jgi:uncharacterized DUF497 family protein
MHFNFEWDPQKAVSNRQKHGISFELAASVFKDPKAISIFDEDHSGKEDRWITVGMAATGAILVVNHTFAATRQDMAVVRLISSRKATKAEQKQYAE